MNKTIISILILLGVIILGYAIYYFPSSKLRDCPDEMIIPKAYIIDETEPQSYYIKDGERKEISDYDTSWVEANCKVPIQEVY